jgi:hypothetical protein
LKQAILLLLEEGVSLTGAFLAAGAGAGLGAGFTGSALALTGFESLTDLPGLSPLIFFAVAFGAGRDAALEGFFSAPLGDDLEALEEDLAGLELGICAGKMVRSRERFGKIGRVF